MNGYVFLVVTTLMTDHHDNAYGLVISKWNPERKLFEEHQQIQGLNIVDHCGLQVGDEYFLLLAKNNGNNIHSHITVYKLFDTKFNSYAHFETLIVSSLECYKHGNDSFVLINSNNLSVLYKWE